MLVVKVIQDLDVFGEKLVRMEIKPDYDSNERIVLGQLGFLWSKYNRNFSKTVTSKKEVRGVIGHLLKSHKNYTLEYVKIVKRKRSGNLNKSLSKLAKTYKTF